MRLSLILIFIRAKSTLITRARVGILGALSAACARDAPAALGRGLQAVLAKRVRRIMENEARPGARSNDEDDRD